MRPLDPNYQNHQGDKEYWEWDEKFNNTPFKLGLDIKEVPIGLLLSITANPNRFPGNRPGAPEYVEVVDGKITLVFFNRLTGSTFPYISEGLWSRNGRDFIATLNQFLQKTDGPSSGDNLSASLFRGGVVGNVTLFRSK